MAKRKKGKNTSGARAKAFAARLRRGRRPVDLLKRGHEGVRRLFGALALGARRSGTAIRRHPVKTFLATILVALCVALVVYATSRPRMPVLAFYRVPESVRNAVVKEATVSRAFAETDFKTIILDETRPLSELTRRPGSIQLLFLEDGLAAERLSGRSAGIPAVAEKALPLSFRESGRHAARLDTVGADADADPGKKAYALPLLADHFEIAWPKTLFERLSLPRPRTTDDFLAGIRAATDQVESPLACAGSDDRVLLFLVSALLSAEHGPAERERVVSALRAGASFRDTLASTRLGDVLRELVSWRDARVLHPEWLRLRERDLQGFMAEEYAAMIFMSLSAHRRVPLKTIVRYESQFFPQGSLAAKNELVAPVYVGMALDSGPRDASARDFLWSLLEPATQGRLSGRSGLAPVALLAEAPDRQAEDVRYWIAASGRAVPDIATASFDDPKRIDDLAREIRAYLETNGTGY